MKKLTEINGPMSKPVYRKKLEALGLIEPGTSKPEMLSMEIDLSSF